MKAAFACMFLAALIIAGSAGVSAFADPLQGATKQRIGNYDFEMKTEPKDPAAGRETMVLLRFAGVNGDDLVDVPITISVQKGGVELYRTNPIVVPYGHHSFEYTFPEPGRYALYVYLNDYAYSGETLTFTFPLAVSGPLDQISAILSIAGALAAGGIGAMVYIRKKKIATG